MTEFIVQFIEDGGYWGIFFLMALENIFPPIPSEVIMGAAGIAVARGTMTFWPLLITGTAGTVLGNYVWFLLGDRFGYERLRPFIERWGRWLTLQWTDIEKATAFFRRHGHWVVFALRFSPFLRTIISLPAGLAHMPLWKFLLFTTAGAAVWNVLLIKGGEWLGSNLEQARVWIEWLTIATIVISVVGYLYRVMTWKPKQSSPD